LGGFFLSLRGFVDSFYLSSLEISFHFCEFPPSYYVVKRVMHVSMEEMMRSSGHAIKLQLLCHNIL
jgi:hypothetical protein